MMHIHFETIDSTNRFAKDLVVANLVAEPIVVTANTQTAGKGSHGRTWYSEDEGGLYYTLILPDVIWLPDPTITRRAAECAVDALAKLCKTPVEIEWPNDLILNGKKVGGILIEGVHRVTTAFLTRKYGIIGIGINVNQAHFPHELRPIATSLCQVEGRHYPRPQLRDLLTKELMKCLYEASEVQQSPTKIPANQY